MLAVERNYHAINDVITMYSMSSLSMLSPARFNYRHPFEANLKCQELIFILDFAIEWRQQSYYMIYCWLLSNSNQSTATNYQQRALCHSQDMIEKGVRIHLSRDKHLRT